MSNGVRVPAESGGVSIDIGEAESGPVPFWRRRRFLERATIVGLAVSLGVHLLLMLVAALVVVRFDGADAGGSGGETVDFAVLTETELMAPSDARVDLEVPTIEDLQTQALESTELLTDVSSTAAESLEASANVDLVTGAGDLSESSLGSESFGSGAAGAGSGASFFGLEAQGRRFAYIVDVSASMRQPTSSGRSRMELTQGELSRSVSDLVESAEFFVALYSDGPLLLGGRTGWTSAVELNKRSARRDIARIYPDGGTRPLGAFERVFGLDPPADAVYFMTDGEFDPGVPEAVARLNRGRRLPVHCIMFGEYGSDTVRQDVERMMRDIARRSGGRFIHVRGPTP